MPSMLLLGGSWALKKEVDNWDTWDYYMACKGY